MLFLILVMEPVLHFLIPVLLLMAFFRRINKILILKLSILTIIMDFDILIPYHHRIAFHNIFFLIIAVLVVYFIAGGLASKIALFFLGSHLICDLLYWGSAFFWPFYKKLISLDIEIYRYLGKWFLDISFKLNDVGIIRAPHKTPYLTPVGTLILVVVIIIFLSYLYNKSQKSKFK